VITYAVEYGGRWHLLEVAPGTMMAFEDEFGQSLPDDPRQPGSKTWRQIAWIAHRVLAPDKHFGTWVDQLTDLTGDEERVAEIRAELDQARPEPAADPTPLKPATGTAS
jgi:hypothetical protein